MASHTTLTPQPLVFSPVNSGVENVEAEGSEWVTVANTVTSNNEELHTHRDYQVEKTSCVTPIVTSNNDPGYMTTRRQGSACEILAPILSNTSGHMRGDMQIEESTSATLTTIEPTHKPAAADITVATPLSVDDQEVQPRIVSPPINVIVFGESGVGKSSVINMLTGEPVAAVSNQAVGCTYASEKFRATIAGREVMLYDTAGLNEAEAGTVSPQRAMQNLRSLVEDLKTVNLLVYCIRGTRFRKIVADNYNIFCKAICGGCSKVPIVLVITGLENEDNMDDWWKDNKAYFDQYKLEFCGHACITATRGRASKDRLGHIFQDLYDDSKKKLVKMMADHAFERSIPIVQPKDTQTSMPGASHWLDIYSLLLSLFCWVGKTVESSIDGEARW